VSGLLVDVHDVGADEALLQLGLSSAGEGASSSEAGAVGTSTAGVVP
jgi:hypothetical protein